MADFEVAVKLTLDFEGGYSSDPNDPGGETYKGISRRNNPDWAGWVIIDGYKSSPEFPRILEADTRLQSLTALEFREGYWKNLYSQIDSQSVANKIFDMGVNMGVGTAVKLLQAALAITQDGFFGTDTLLETNRHGDDLLAPYKAKLVQHYENLVAANPALGKFLAGWLRRANS